MKIGRLSELTRLSIDTLRYYERLGLIDPPFRKGGQRLYDPDAVRWIEFLKALKATGMSLEDMKRYALMRARGHGTAANRRVMLENQHAKVLSRIAELSACATLLEYKIANYHDIEASHELADKTRHAK
ncbi:MerR family transcriptional regulator [Hoeflea marina]|uniref:MerR family transcriptional regulator n=1 Tax=Hoeflea marina TaxID=274592 RepID=A0A317PHY1_9HYPH|nr:MerR family transcriptional regulator [Hoeflea marina]PWW00053.1 MerR family transcriptional regulator [Hoeflea marina]